jgi:DNA-binding MurR/RpiR family transcriptional regulator
MDPTERVRSVYDSLSKTQRRIADLLLQRKDTACFMSLKRLSDEASVAPVTVLNFVKKIGYDNYSEFKRDFQSYIQSVISPRNVVRESFSYDIESSSEVIEKIRQSEKQLIEESYAMINDDHIMSAVLLIKQARKVYLVAKNMSLPVASMLQRRLVFLGLDSELMNLENLNILPRALARADGLDVFIVFSFPNYSQLIGDVAKCARQRGSRIICVTDKTISPAARYADVVLLCQTASVVFYNSMTAPLSLTHLLATLLAIELREKIDANQETYRLLASYLEKDIS